MCGCISPYSYWAHSDLLDTLSLMQEMPPNCPYLPLDEQWNNTKERGFIGSAAAAVLGNVQAQLKTLAHDASDGNASFVSLHAVDSMYQDSKLPLESSKHSQVLQSTPALSVMNRKQAHAYCCLPGLQEDTPSSPARCLCMFLARWIWWRISIAGKTNMAFCSPYYSHLHQALSVAVEGCLGQSYNHPEEAMLCAGRDGSPFKFDDKFISSLQQGVKGLAAKLHPGSSAVATAIKTYVESTAAHFLRSKVLSWPKADIL